MTAKTDALVQHTEKAQRARAIIDENSSASLRGYHNARLHQDVLTALFEIIENLANAQRKKLVRQAYREYLHILKNMLLPYFNEELPFEQNPYLVLEYTSSSFHEGAPIILPGAGVHLHYTVPAPSSGRYQSYLLWEEENKKKRDQALSFDQATSQELRQKIARLTAVFLQLLWVTHQPVAVACLLPVLQKIYGVYGVNAVTSLAVTSLQNNLLSEDLQNVVQAKQDLENHLQTNCASLFGEPVEKLEEMLAAEEDRFDSKRYIWHEVRSHLLKCGTEDSFECNHFFEAVKAALVKPYLECWYRNTHKQLAREYVNSLSTLTSDNKVTSQEKYKSAKTLTINFIDRLNQDHSQHLLPEMIPLLDYFSGKKFQDRNKFYHEQEVRFRQEYSWFMRLFKPSPAKDLTEDDKAYLSASCATENLKQLQP